MDAAASTHDARSTLDFPATARGTPRALHLRVTRSTTHALLLTLLAACGPVAGGAPESSPDASASPAPASSSDDGGAITPDAGDAGTTSAPCAFDAPLTAGRACAIDPTATDPAITRTFGYHALGLPSAITASTPVYVHFVGSGGDPAKPDTRAFPNQLLMEELTARGVLVVMPSYDNDPSVGSLCKEDLACYEAVRREILTGEDAPAPYSALKDVRAPNDARSRIAALIAAVAKSGLLGADPPAALASGQLAWSKARLGGHSQGGGHAALIAKTTAVERLCMLSSPIDGAGEGAAAVAVPWVSGTWATDLSRRRAVIHQDDRGFDKASANFAAMGLVEDTHWKRLRFATTDPHAATVKDPTAAPARAACVL